MSSVFDDIVRGVQDNAVLVGVGIVGTVVAAVLLLPPPGNGKPPEGTPKVISVIVSKSVVLKGETIKVSVTTAPAKTGWPINAKLDGPVKSDLGQVTVTDALGNAEFTINTAELPAGSYALMVNEGQSSFTVDARPPPPIPQLSRIDVTLSGVEVNQGDTIGVVATARDQFGSGLGGINLMMRMINEMGNAVVGPTAALTGTTPEGKVTFGIDTRNIPPGLYKVQVADNSQFRG